MKGRVAALALLAALVGACGTATEPARLPDPGLLAEPLAYRCDNLVFVPALFDRPGTCQGYGGAPATVDLGMTIGDRTLIDPSTWPNPTIEVGP